MAAEGDHPGAGRSTTPARCAGRPLRDSIAIFRASPDVSPRSGCWKPGCVGFLEGGCVKRRAFISIAFLPCRCMGPEPSWRRVPIRAGAGDRQIFLSSAGINSGLSGSHFERGHSLMVFMPQCWRACGAACLFKLRPSVLLQRIRPGGSERWPTGHRPGEPPFLLWHGCTNAAGRHCSWMAMAACKLAASAVVRAGPLHAIARQTSNASRQGTSHFLGRNWGLMVAS